MGSTPRSNVAEATHDWGDDRLQHKALSGIVWLGLLKHGVDCSGCDVGPAVIDDILFHVMLSEMDALQSELQIMQRAAQKPPTYFSESSWPRQKLRMAVVHAHQESEALLLSLLRSVCEYA